MTGANEKGIRWRRKNTSDLSIWILKGTGFYCQNLVSDVCAWAAFPDCTGCHNTKMQHNSDCPALFMFSLWELGSDFSLNTSFTACYSDSAKSIHILSTKQRMKGIMEKERYYSDRERWIPLHKHITGSIHRNKIIIFFFSNTKHFSKYM